MSNPFFFPERADGMIHLWIGPLGLHLAWPAWKSRFDWQGDWR